MEKMTVSVRGVFALALHEGIVPGPYLDSVGIWTYGIGHTLSAGKPDPELMPRGMPEDLDAALVDVVALFRRDLAKYEAAVRAAVKVPLAAHEFDALVSFHYNTGAIARAQLTRLLNAGRRSEAATAFMGWRKPIEIIARRGQERNLFKFGIYPTGKIPVWRVSETGRVIWRAARHIESRTFLAMLGTSDGGVHV